jgi:hypothetical protein
MSRMFGKHIPDEYVSDWSSEKYNYMNEYWHWYMCGHEDGYKEADFFNKNINDERLKRENDMLKGELVTLSKTKQDLIEESDAIKSIVKKYTEPTP